ncbi:MAG: hypothetical protein IJY39_08995 [Clostridia bacterium]|nr:hypothetical protein [Clostridia bacterium]
MKYQKILTKADAQAFLERYGGFHDALIVGIDFKASVKSENQGDHIWFSGNPDLIIRLLAHGMYPSPPVVELVFRGVWDLNLKLAGQPTFELYGAIIEPFPDHIIFADCHTTDREIMKNSRYVYAEELLWRELGLSDHL